jgi:hypothetical protein
MFAAFGVDILAPGVSLRRIWSLLSRLPPQYRAGGEAWSTEAELLALVVDHLANLAWITARAAGAKNAARPRPLPRPTDARVMRERPPAAPREPTRGDSAWVGQLALIPGVVVEADPGA